ncbi:MAG: VOC family protein, partial [Pseudomonadales bacterium]
DKVVDLKNTSADWVMLRAANSQVELFQYHTPAHAPGDPNRPVNKPGFTHICLEVTNLQELYERLLEHGVRFNSEPMDHGDMGCFANYSRDPDGNVIEFVEYMPGNIESLTSFLPEA